MWCGTVMEEVAGVNNPILFQTTDSTIHTLISCSHDRRERDLPSVPHSPSRTGCVNTSPQVSATIS